MCISHSVLNRKSNKYTPDELRVELEEKQRPNESALLVEDGIEDAPLFNILLQSHQKQTLWEDVWLLMLSANKI